MMAARRFDIRQWSARLLAVYLGLLVLNAGFYLVATRPRAAAYAELTVSSAPRLRALQVRQQQVEELEAYAAALAQAEKDLDFLQTQVLSTKRQRMIDVRLELARLAQRFNIDLEQVRYENQRLEEEGLERMAMVVPLEGGYQNLRNFLQAVETSDKFLVIERVALAQGREGGVMLQLDITVATYFRLEDGPRPASPGPGRA